MTLHDKKQKQQGATIPGRKITTGTSKKWQKLFRYTEEREKAIKKLVTFVYLIRDLSERSLEFPDSIHDTNGGEISL